MEHKGSKETLQNKLSWQWTTPDIWKNHEKIVQLGKESIWENSCNP